MTTTTPATPPVAVPSRPRPPTGVVRRTVRANQLLTFAVLSLILSWIPWAIGGFTRGDINPTGPAMAAPKAPLIHTIMRRPYRPTG